MRPTTFNWGGYATAAPTSIALAQSLAAAGNFNLNGALAASVYVMVAQIPPDVTTKVATLPVSGYISFVSTATETSKSFTITGTNNSGAVISEVVTGVSAAPVLTGQSYKTVTSIAANAATVGNVSVGTAQTGCSDWIPLDIYVPNQVTTISATVTGTVNYSVQYTNENPFDLSITQQVVSHPVAALVGATANQTGTTTTLMRAVRLLINSGSGSVRCTIAQQSTQ